MQNVEVRGMTVGYPEFKARRKMADKKRKEEDAKRVRPILGDMGFLNKIEFEIFSFINEDDGGSFKTGEEKPKAKIINIEDLKQKPVA